MLLALLVLVAFAGLIVLLSSRYVQVGEVRVPEVVGGGVQDASRSLRELGFEVSTYIDAAAAAAPESVTAQTPAAGAVVRRGRGVALGVSARGDGSIPNLVGLTQEQATTRLEEAQLEVAGLGYHHAPQAEGTVLSQRPAAGNTRADPAVQLTVSLGPPPRRVVLPRVVGQRVDLARRRLERLGFRRVELVPTRLGAPGVNAQSPRAGVRTEVSAQVTLYYTVGNRQVVPVPAIVGLDVQGAAERLQAAGLRVGWVVPEAFDPTKPRGVLAVTPEDYTLWGTPVTLRTNGNAGTFRAREPALPQGPFASPQVTGSQTVGSQAVGSQATGQPNTLEQPGSAVTPGQVGQTDAAAARLPATGGREIPISIDPANYSFLQGRAYTLRVEVTDAAGDRVALSRTMGPDEAVADTVVVYGEAELRMYIDDQIILAYNPPNP